MQDRHYTPRTSGATVPESTTHGATVQVRSGFPTHGDNFVTVARLDTAQDMQDFTEALGIYHDMVYCLELFTNGLKANQ